MHSSTLPHRRFQTHRDPEAAERALNDAEAERINEKDNKKAQREAMHLAGRIILAAVFIVSAIVKASWFNPDAAGSLGGVFWLSIVLELVCGALLAVGLYARKAALVMLLWIGVGIVFFHGDLSLEVNRVFALANLGIAGGLFGLVANGGGLLSVDRLLKDRREAALATT